MSTYTKPTVTKIGAITEKTQGGWTWQDLEIMSKRACGGGS